MANKGKQCAYKTRFCDLLVSSLGRALQVQAPSSLEMDMADMSGHLQHHSNSLDPPALHHSAHSLDVHHPAGVRRIRVSARGCKLPWPIES